LRHLIQQLGLAYVLAIGCHRRMHTHGGLIRVGCVNQKWFRGLQPIRVDRIAAELADRAWQRYSSGRLQGPRLYEWAWIALNDQDTAKDTVHARPG
jgi:hypothetical protein